MARVVVNSNRRNLTAPAIYFGKGPAVYTNFTRNLLVQVKLGNWTGILVIRGTGVLEELELV